MKGEKKCQCQNTDVKIAGNIFWVGEYFRFAVIAVAS